MFFFVCLQQHGSVYWQKNAGDILGKLDPGDFLHIQLASCFSVPDSPIWMDSSTTKQCKMLEEAVGGPEVSRAYFVLICFNLTNLFKEISRNYWI